MGKRAPAVLFLGGRMLGGKIFGNVLAHVAARIISLAKGGIVGVSDFFRLCGGFWRCMTSGGSTAEGHALQVSRVGSVPFLGL